MSTPDTASFDHWYANIAASARRDRWVGDRLQLPPDVQSTGYLSGPGLAEILDRLPRGSEGRLVELGCGRGGYGMAAVRATGARLVGIDVSAVALAAARVQAARLGLADVVEFRVGDLAATGLPTGSADAVLCVDAFHFASSPAAAAAEIRRLLRPGGRLVLTGWEPAQPGDPRLPERLRDVDVSRHLSAAGLVEVDREPRPGWSRIERALWEAAVVLDPAGDPALADLVEEARQFRTLAAALRRVLVTAEAPAAGS